jgi:hypothetical protein
MRTKIASQADAIGKGKAIVNGMQAHEAEMKSIGLDPAELSALVDRFVLLDGKQEAAKGNLHNISDELNATKDRIKGLVGRITSSLEGKYGKTSPTLEDFGIAPRQVNPHKGPRVKKAANNTQASHLTATNIPANNMPAGNIPANSPTSNNNQQQAAA